MKSAAALFVASLASASPASPSSEIASVLEGFEARGFSGVVLVAADGEIVFQSAVGLRDRERGLANTLDTRFELMSITKLFVPLAMLMLEDEGKLSLGTGLDTYFGPFPGAAPTAHALLLHTAGFPGSGRELDKSSSDAYVDAILRVPREASDEPRYSNPGYALGAILVERVSGLSFREFLRRRVFEPAGMSATGFTGEVESAMEAVTATDGQVLVVEEHGQSVFGFVHAAS